MVIQCCRCGRVRQDDEWIDQADGVEIDQPVSHGYCATCADAAFGEFLESFPLEAEATPVH